ncbi:hypothetical protein VPH35_120738 [Triticum aestivum]
MTGPLCLPTLDFPPSRVSSAARLQPLRRPYLSYSLRRPAPSPPPRRSRRARPHAPISPAQAFIRPAPSPSRRPRRAHPAGHPLPPPSPTSRSRRSQLFLHRFLMASCETLRARPQRYFPQICLTYDHMEHMVKFHGRTAGLKRSEEVEDYFDIQFLTAEDANRAFNHLKGKVPNMEFSWAPRNIIKDKPPTGIKNIIKNISIAHKKIFFSSCFSM